MCEQHSFLTRTQKPYTILLNTREWGEKRIRILARDKYTCTRCGQRESENVSLQVHHRHYINGLDPWEYKDSELVTLCESCHSFVHNYDEIPIYQLLEGNLVKISLTPCLRCAGDGWFPEYRHVRGGVCFRCHGQKYEELIEVAENYAIEHDIDMEDIDSGFLPLDIEIEGVGRIVEARVRERSNHNGVYVELIMYTGLICPCCLDFSVNAASGDRLDTSTLLYRKAVKKNGEKYIIIKGHVMAS